MAAAAHPSDSNVCFAELIVRLDSLLTLRNDEDEGSEEEKAEARSELESDIKRKLTEIHLRLKNGGSVHDRSSMGAQDEEEEDEAVEDSQGPSSAAEGGGAGSVDCVGCSSAEDENEACPSPVQPKGKPPYIFLFSNDILLLIRSEKTQDLLANPEAYEPR